MRNIVETGACLKLIVTEDADMNSPLLHYAHEEDCFLEVVLINMLDSQKQLISTQNVDCGVNKYVS